MSPMMSSRRNTRKKLWSPILLAVLGQIALLHAQEVRKATPVPEPAEPPVPRAVPVSPPVAQPVAPKAPDEDLFAYATLCYTQKDYKIAIKPYSDYTRLYPQGTHAAEAWFRLGECYLKTDQNDLAKQAYGNVVSRFPKSEGASSASYRLGSFAYNEHEYLKAAQYFETCEKLTTDPNIKLAATYNTGLSYKLAGLPAKAFSAYKAVIATKGENAYLESSLHEAAAIALEAGRKEEALALFNQLIEVGKDPTVVGEALIKAGLLLIETGKFDAAIKDFKRALEIHILPKTLRGAAVYGLIKGYYNKGDYGAVVDTYIANPDALPSEDLRPEMLLMVGNSQKQKQSYRQAIEIYLMIEKQFPDSREAFEAGYQKLLCFRSLEDKDLPQFTESFEQRYAAKYKDHAYITMSRLIRADWYFTKGDYPKASEAFAGVNASQVPTAVRGATLYRKGFAQAEAGQYNDAIATLTEFIDNYPKDSNVPMALAQRGMSQKAVNSFEKALADFTTIIKKYSDTPAAEIAYYESGLIKKELRDVPGEIADLQTLVSKFPESSVAVDAWYEIGFAYFEMKTKDGYTKSIAPLHKCLELDSKKKYLDKAHQLLISSQYLREDVDGAAKEIDAYLDARPEASILPAILIFVGVKYYERGNPAAAERYLTKVSTPKEPNATEPMVWNFLGLAQLDDGNFESAVQSFDNYMAQIPDGEGHARALLGRGRALLGLGKFDDADQCVVDALTKVKEGQLHARLLLLQGDIAMARGDALEATADHANALLAWKKAAGSYVVVSQIFVDPAITPEALYKAALVLEKLGEKDKADILRKTLESKYPGYKPKAAK